MKKIYLLISILFTGFITFSQTVISERTATLQGLGSYSATGSVTLSELDDGTFRISLDENFSTTGGPDVQLLLTVNDQEINGSVMITDLSDDNHFNGARTYNVPSSVTSIDQFDHIYIVCVMYTVPWGKGALGNANAVTGINDLKENNTLEIFPNPASEKVNIITPEGFEESSIKIYSTQGNLLKTLSSINQEETTLLINDLDSGLYFITMENDLNVYSQQLVVKK